MLKNKTKKTKKTKKTSNKIPKPKNTKKINFCKSCSYYENSKLNEGVCKKFHKRLSFMTKNDCSCLD